MTYPTFSARMALPSLALAFAAVACDKPGSPAAAPGAAPVAVKPPAAETLEFSCDLPVLRRQWPAFDALGDEVGAANFTLGESDEGFQDAYLYKQEPRRRIELRFNPRGMEDPVVLSGAVVSDPGSAWALPGGLKMGSTLEAVEQFNGRPFRLVTSGAGATTDDWQEGQLSDFAVKGCHYFINFKAARAGAPQAPTSVLSNDPAVRAQGLTIQRFGMSRYTP